MTTPSTENRPIIQPAATTTVTPQLETIPVTPLDVTSDTDLQSSNGKRRVDVSEGVFTREQGYTCHM